MVLHDGETFITKEAPAMLQGLDEQIKVSIYISEIGNHSQPEHSLVQLLLKTVITVL